MALEKPLPVPSKHPDQQPLVCVQLNAAWIPYIVGLIQPMKFHNFWAGTLAENQNARRDAQNLILLFQEAGECGDMANNCCDGSDLLVTVLTRITLDGKIQISIDGGITWQDNPRAPYMQTPQYPPYLESNVGVNTCDVAKNVQEELLRLKDGFIQFLRTVTVLHDFLIDIVEMLAEAIAVLLEAPAGVNEILPSIFDWARHLFVRNPDELEAEFTPDFWDKVLCIIYCNTPTNGVYQESDFDNIIGQCANLPGGVVFGSAGECVRGFIKFWQVQGLNTVAQNGTSVGADCSACNCGMCDITGWIVSTGIEVSRADGVVVITPVLGADGHYAVVFQSPDINQCCMLSDYHQETGVATVNAWNLCGETFVGTPLRHTGLHPFNQCINALEYFNAEAGTMGNITLTFKVGGC